MATLLEKVMRRYPLLSFLIACFVALLLCSPTTLHYSDPQILLDIVCCLMRLFLSMLFVISIW